MQFARRFRLVQKFLDPVLPDAGGDLHIHNLAYPAPDQGTADRGQYRDFVLIDISVMGIHKGIYRTFLGFHVHHAHGGIHGHYIGLDLFRGNHPRMVQFLLQVVDISEQAGVTLKTEILDVFLDPLKVHFAKHNPVGGSFHPGFGLGFVLHDPILLPVLVSHTQEE